MVILRGELAAWLGLAWLGFRGGPPHADFPMSVSVTVCSVCVCTCTCCCLLQYMLPYAFRRRLEMHGDFTGGVGSMAWLGLSTCGCVYMYVCSHAWALLQYMLPYAFRRRVEMHGDFTGGVDSMVWLGLAWLPRGWGVEADRYTYAFRWHLEMHGHAVGRAWQMFPNMPS